MNQVSYLLPKRYGDEEMASRVIRSGFSKYLSIFLDNWDKGINTVCSPDEIIRWFLDEPLPENLKILLGQRCSQMHTIAVALSNYGIQEYIIPFWNNGYDNVEDVKTLNEQEIKVLIKRVNVSESDAEKLRAFLNNFKTL